MVPLSLYLVLVMLFCERPDMPMGMTYSKTSVVVRADAGQAKEEALRLMIGQEPEGYTCQLQDTHGSRGVHD